MYSVGYCSSVIYLGVIREVARRVFNMEINMTMMGRTQQVVQLAHETHLEEHVTFRIQVQSDAQLQYMYV